MLIACMTHPHPRARAHAHRAGVLEAALSPCPAGLEPLLGSSSRTSPTPGAPGSGSGSGASVSYPGVVLTTYDQLRLHRDLLLRVRWGVAVLDEGHKIRNPDSEITLVCKQVGGGGVSCVLYFVRVQY